jgi:hypothetical protein
VLTSRRAETPSASPRAAHVAAAAILSVITFTSAYAGGIINLNCVGGGKSLNCVAQWATAAGDPNIRAIPETLGDAEKAYATARDHQWLARCRPVIERDGYGVPRYRYSAQGCEFGVGTD